MSDEQSASEKIAAAAIRAAEHVRIGHDPEDYSKRTYHRLCDWVDADDLLFVLIGSSPFVDTLTARFELFRAGELGAANAITGGIELVQSMHDKRLRSTDGPNDARKVSVTKTQRLADTKR